MLTRAPSRASPGTPPSTKSPTRTDSRDTGPPRVAAAADAAAAPPRFFSSDATVGTRRTATRSTSSSFLGVGGPCTRTSGRVERPAPGRMLDSRTSCAARSSCAACFLRAAFFSSRSSTVSSRSHHSVSACGGRQGTCEIEGEQRTTRTHTLSNVVTVKQCHTYYCHMRLSAAATQCHAIGRLPPRHRAGTTVMSHAHTSSRVRRTSKYPCKNRWPCSTRHRNLVGAR
jgi:hypothetical protein